jgi:fatty-acyl-CoA synthase
MPDAYAGELPVLYVVVKEGGSSDEASIGAFVAERIGEPPARPRKVFILAEMPLTPLGKIARYRLRQLAAEHAVRTALVDIDPAVRAECPEPTAKQVRLGLSPAAASAPPESVDDILARLGMTRLA